MKAKKDENSNADQAVPAEEETKISEDKISIDDGSESSTTSDSVTSVMEPAAQPTPKRKVGRPSGSGLKKTTVSFFVKSISQKFHWTTKYFNFTKKKFLVINCQLLCLPRVD